MVRTHAQTAVPGQGSGAALTWVSAAAATQAHAGGEQERSDRHGASLTCFTEHKTTHGARGGLGRRISAAPFTAMDLHVQPEDRVVLIASGAVAVMAPGEFEAATALVGAGGVVALQGGAAPGEAAQLVSVGWVEARALSEDALEEAPDAGRRLRDSAVRTLRGLHACAQQTAVCVLRHPVPHRIAAWLLALRQGLEDDEIRIGHAALARLAGVRRTTVTASLADLGRAGAVRCGRSRILITDPARLAAASCGCASCVA
jgi:CRP-like cAMP-binding protein